MTATTEISGKIFINGTYETAHAQEFSKVINPATEEIIAQFPICNAHDVHQAYTAASNAFQSWRWSTPKERFAALHALADTLEAHAEEIIALEVAQTGQKPELVASDNLYPSTDQLRFFGGVARSLSGLSAGEYVPGRTSFIRREAVGVIGQVAPWNYPIMMAIWKIGPAIAAGNTVVLKPSDTTPLTALKIAELSAGILPDGVLNVLTGSKETGRLVVEHPDAAHVSITGSVRAGKEVALSAANGLKRVQLELGGKAPVVVFSDADLTRAAQTIAYCGYYNAGQDCTAATRVLVEESIAKEFTDLLIAQAQALTETIEPVNNISQLTRITEKVAHIPSHASLLCGGYRINKTGYFYAPTIITGLHQDDALIQEEIFGPVITVQTFSTQEQALTMSNDVEYGLSASIWTQDVTRAVDLSRKIDSGVVWINDHLTFTAELPHGGFKKSGFGKDMSLYSVEEYTRIKHVMINIE